MSKNAQFVKSYLLNSRMFGYTIVISEVLY